RAPKEGGSKDDTEGPTTPERRTAKVAHLRELDRLEDTYKADVKYADDTSRLIPPEQRQQEKATALTKLEEGKVRAQRDYEEMLGRPPRPGGSAAPGGPP